MSEKIANIGDIVLCWRPSIVFPEHYEAEVVRIIGNRPIYEVKPIRGLFRVKRFVSQSHMAGITRDSATSGKRAGRA